MKNHRALIELITQEKEEVVNISKQVHQAVKASGIKEGFCLVFPQHTSSAVFINDSDFSITADIMDVLKACAPAGAGYRHDETDYKRNADGHIKAVLCSHHITLPITGGKLDLGCYQTIYYAEFDGQRPKEIVVKIIGE